MNEDRELREGLRRLAEDTVVPSLDAAQEQRLLAAFDAHWSARRRRTYARPLAAAGLIAAVASVAWMVATRGHRAEAVRPTGLTHLRPTSDRSDTPQTSVRPTSDRSDTPQTGLTPAVRRPQRRPARPPAADTTFVMWPGARNLPRFESGQLMRVELPASVVVSLGLRPPQPSAFVQTDVLVGQDGYARAVRLVQ